MCMARPKKKLKQNDINRNTSIEVSHTIRKIKENERKYTVILVIFFMIVISIVGYHVFTINSDSLYSDIKTGSSNSSYLSLSSSNIVLTKEDILSDDVGMNTNKYIIHLENNTGKIKQYKVYFVSDHKDTCKCGNKVFDKKFIRYSVDNEVKTLKDGLFVDGVLKKNESKDILFNMWISEEINKNSDLHLHGHFIIK